MAGPGWVEHPLTFREFALADLYRGQRLIAKVHPDPIDPQVRVLTPDSNFGLAVTLSPAPVDRMRRMDLIRDFMAWKLAVAFVYTSELLEPDCVIAIAVAHREQHGCLSLIARTPRLDFAPVDWLPAASLGNDIPGLMPRGQRTLSAARIAELEQFFGAGGQFPAGESHERFYPAPVMMLSR